MNNDIIIIELEEVEIASERKGVNIPDRWATRRRQTICMFLLSQYLQGVEFTTIFTTLWIYVNNDIHSADPYFSYGIIASGRFVATLLFTSLLAKWFDRTRSTKCFMLVAVSLMNVGYILYMIPYSPIIPTLGTMFQGCTILITVIVNSEINRIYADNYIQRNVLYMLFAYGLGECTGPVIMIALSHIPSFRIGAIEITYGNIAGLVLLILNSIRLVLVYFFTYDVSKEFDLKAQNNSDPTKNTPSSWFSTMKLYFSFDLCFLVV